MVFFEEYFEYMDDMTPEQFYQFMGLIRDLRYKGIDTEAKDIEDKDVRLAWRAVRPSVKKSLQNAKDYKKKQQKEEPTQPVEDYDPTFDNCIQTLQMIRAEDGDYAMEAEANRMAKANPILNVKELCIAARGH